MNSSGPLITPLPGVSREHLRDALRQLHTDAFNMRGGTYGSGHALLTRYLAWASTAVRMLGNQVSREDIDRLILTRGYERLTLGGASLAALSSPAILNDLLNLELNQRVDDVEDAIKALDEAISRWSGPGKFAVADTSVYIEHEQKLEELDFAAVLSITEEPIRLLVPIIIVDELEGVKRRGDHSGWRAGYTLAVLDRLFTSTTGPAQLRPEDFSALGSGGIPRGEVTMELVFDPPGHIRLPINDDEIVGRALAMQALAGREITLLTFDTNQSMRARHAGLTARKLSKPLGEEPIGQRVKRGSKQNDGIAAKS